MPIGLDSRPPRRRLVPTLGGKQTLAIQPEVSFWPPCAVTAPRQQQGCAESLTVTATAFNIFLLPQTRTLTSDSLNSFLLINKYRHVPVHSPATMPPRRGGRGNAATPAPDPSPRPQRSQGPARMSTSYGSPAMYAAGRSSTSSSLGGIGNALRSVRTSNAADGHNGVNQRPAGADNQNAAPPNNRDPATPPAPQPAAPPVVPPAPVQQPFAPANNQGRFLVV